jgi:rhodanese-related sulfurtransferase
MELPSIDFETMTLNFSLHETSRDSGICSDDDFLNISTEEDMEAHTMQSSPLFTRYAISQEQLTPEVTNGNLDNRNGKPQMKSTKRTLFGSAGSNLKQVGKTSLDHRTKEVFSNNTLAFSELNTDKETLIGDCTQECSLPTMDGKHKDLKSICPQIMSRLVNGELSDTVGQFIVVDCRYPYEFEGGHIKNAINIWDQETLKETFFLKSNQTISSNKLIIFHCEFSSERGPRMLRYMRQLDREINKESYPSLNYPELYILEGGYKSFYQQHQQLCIPQTYKPMLDKKHVEDLKYFRIKSKTSRKPRSQKMAKSLRTEMRKNLPSKRLLMRL